MAGIYNDAATPVIIAKFTAPLTIRSNQPTTLSDTLSLKRVISQKTAQRWEVEAGLEPLSSGANALFAHLVTKGYNSVINILMPQNYGVILQLPETPPALIVASDVALGNSQLTVNTNNAVMVPIGCFITFANHNKVYMITTADVAKSATASTMYIYPPLQVAVTLSTVITYKDVKMPCYLETDSVRGMTYSDGILMDVGTIKLVEAR